MKKSKNSAFYFFLLFVIAIFSITFYKSVYAVLSPKQLRSFLQNKLENEVDLKSFELQDVTFHFFHNYWFHPTVQWTGVDLAYIKNCNQISLKSPDLFVSLDILSLLQKKIKVEQIESEDLEFQILRNKKCENLSQQEKKVLPSLAKESEKPKKFTASVDYVKDLPNFYVHRLKFSTEKNPGRYYVFNELEIKKNGENFDFRSSLKFSSASNLGFLPQFNLRGSFDRFQNINLQARIREANLYLYIEPLGEENFKTSLEFKDFPLQYVMQSLGRKEFTDKMPSHWMNLKFYTISHWDDFFAKNIPLQVDRLDVYGEEVKASAKPFTFHLKNRYLMQPFTIHVEKANLKTFKRIYPDLWQSYLPYEGQWAGNIQVQTFDNIEWQGVWKNLRFILPLEEDLLLYFTKANSKGAIRQLEAKETMTSAFYQESPIQGEVRLEWSKDTAAILNHELAQMPNAAMPLFNDSAGIGLNTRLTPSMHSIELLWQDVSADEYKVAKASYKFRRDLDIIQKDWLFQNLVFTDDNSFLNALASVHTGIAQTKSIYTAERQALYKNDRWQAEWHLQLNQPRLKLQLKNESISDWHIIKSIPELQQQKLVFQEDVLPL